MAMGTRLRMSDRQRAFVSAMTAFAELLLLALLFISSSAIVQADRDADRPVGRYNGCSLDAAIFDPPAFTGNDEPCYKVMDRATGEQWWLVRMNGGWVGMPISKVEK